MNAPNPLPEVLLSAQPTDQPNRPLGHDGVQGYVWKSAYGPMFIEVCNGVAYVNSERVTSVHELKSGGA